MLKTILKITIICLTTLAYAQETEVINGLLNPLSLALNNSDLYICEHSGNNLGQGKISKIDLNENNPVKIELVTDLVYPRAVCLYGNNLYFSGSSLYKIDITEANPVAEELMYLSSTYSLIEIDDFLYIARDNGIYKFDLNSSNPSVTSVIILPTRPLNFVYRDGYLYFGYSNKVGRIDPTVSNPTLEILIENLESNVYSIIFYEDTLLLGLSLSSKIVKVDFNQTPLVAEEFIDTEIGRPNDFVIWNNDLYIAGGIGENIFKIENLSSVLNVDEQIPFLAVGIYPNPSNNLINIFGMQEQYSFEIINSNGQQVLKGQRRQAEYIDVSNLASGIYYIKLKDNRSREHILKFTHR